MVWVQVRLPVIKKKEDTRSIIERKSRFKKPSQAQNFNILSHILRNSGKVSIVPLHEKAITQFIYLFYYKTFFLSILMQISKLVQQKK